MIEAAYAVRCLPYVVQMAINIESKVPIVNLLLEITVNVQEGEKVVAPAWYNERWIIGELLLCNRCHIPFSSNRFKLLSSTTNTWFLITIRKSRPWHTLVVSPQSRQLAISTSCFLCLLLIR